MSTASLKDILRTQVSGSRYFRWYVYTSSIYIKYAI